MSQTWDSTAPAQTNEWDDDLLAMKNKFDTLQSSFSGATAPTSPVAGQVWHDTGSGTLKAYPDSGSTWLAILKGDASLKIPVYRNDTCEGWTIDSSVTDRVIALKGGSQAYNANGGTNAGTWQTEDHTLTTAEVPNLNIQVRDNAGAGGGQNTIQVFTNNNGSYVTVGTTTNSGGGGHNHGTNQRVAAALCTLQYPDLS